MIISRLRLKNWRNFRTLDADIDLQRRQFLIGPNASGKSNFLDVFRFLRDIANPEGGGLQKAIRDRGGVSKLHNLATRGDPEITIEVALASAPNSAPEWRYGIGIKQETSGNRKILLTHERVWCKDKQILDRPDDQDRADPLRLTQTFLEQINANQAFRDIADFFGNITYLHLVPQLLRFANAIQGQNLENDPFGQGFLERIANTPDKTRQKRLGRIEEALKTVIPQSKQLRFVRDKDNGRPHIEALYTHWRPNAGWQREDQFSDGALRLIGMLWMLLEGRGLLLLEEPELSLHAGIIGQLAALISTMQRTRNRQVLISTHSDALLGDPGIDGREVLVLTPDKEGTDILPASDFEDIKALLASGFTVGEVALPRTTPSTANQLSIAIG
uniref:Predicted ATPase n=1 Tax=Candidatus Kentrum sp. MB TaxID=2138164 RepID=A0A450X5E7_9GAMM|nr:MAG: Predicted ATPase [Candidatus Kentron sp. MB]VFK30725.1 MAG: Predicted ATPase [Candidatus Kentron sp. MB]VFK75332.1 MAG: Predicted ATPase [Candidatus Kentron sp. MB]